MSSSRPMNGPSPASEPFTRGDGQRGALGLVLAAVQGASPEQLRGQLLADVVAYAEPAEAALEVAVALCDLARDSMSVTARDRGLDPADAIRGFFTALEAEAIVAEEATRV